jgi:3-dehydroquinate synthase
MTTPDNIPVHSRHGDYVVHVGTGLAAKLGDRLESLGLPQRRFVVSQARIWRLHGRLLAPLIPRREPILMPDGERYKTLTTVSRIYDALIRAAADRATTIVAFGGGVVGDVAGFAAASYLRGVPVVQVPTTLLAQVDAAVGGKVGVNHAQGKNLVGAFYPPAAVVADPLVLATLPRRQFRSGLYEVVKYGMIASRHLFDRIADGLPDIFAREPAVLRLLVAESCRIKADVVGQDELERGPRRVLNFGHTVGHALETITRYRRYLHGEAVALGMLVVAELAVARGVMSSTDRDRLVQLIMQMGPLPALGDLSAAAALAAIRLDKKVAAGRLHLVLPLGIGSVAIVGDVTDKELTRAMRKTGMQK